MDRLKYFISKHSDTLIAMGIVLAVLMVLMFIASKVSACEKPKTTDYSIRFGFAGDMKSKRRDQWNDNPLGIIDLEVCPKYFKDRPYKKLLTFHCVGYRHFSSAPLQNDPREADWFFWQFGMRLEL